jgi:outer membrane receptor protein involved in Fe transport
LPGVDLAGTARPSGQSLNIWGFNKVQDVKVILDGVPKGFEKYRQGSIFIEPELIKQIEVNKGAHTSLYGNGGFGGVITVETKDAKDMLEGEEKIGAMVKYARHSNNGKTTPPWPCMAARKMAASMRWRLPRSASPTICASPMASHSAFPPSTRHRAWRS